MLKGKLTPSEDITISSEETIKDFDIRDQFKYLAMFQSNEVGRKEIYIYIYIYIIYIYIKYV